MEDNRHRPVTSAPYPPGREDIEDTRHRPAMSTPYPPGREHPSCDMSTPRFPCPVCIEMSDTPTHQHTEPRQEGRPSHRPAAPIQRFNNTAVQQQPSGGQLGSVTSKRWPMYMDGIRINEHCRWFRTWTRRQ